MSHPRPLRPVSLVVIGALLLLVMLLLAALPAVSGAKPLMIQPTWAKSINWSGPSVESLTDVATSADGAMLWSCGSTGPGDGDLDLTLVRIPTSGLRIFKYTWDGQSRLDDAATALATAADGSVYTAGYSTRRPADRDIAIVKWSRLGRTIWMRPYAASRYADVATDVVVDRFGNVTLCGTVGGVTGNDWVTVSWSASGVRRWVRTFAGSGGADDSPAGMVVDSDGSVYVTGSESRADGHAGGRTIKYSRTGVVLWSKAFTPASRADVALRSIARRPAGGVFVGGYEKEGGAVVLRYTARGSASRVVTGTTRFYAEGMAVTSDGGWVLGGAGLANPYVERYAASGTLIASWLLTPALDPEKPTNIAEVAADSAGKVYWAGFATSTNELIVGCRGKTGIASDWTGAWAGAGWQPRVQAALWSGGALYVVGSHTTATPGTDGFVLKYKK